MSAPTTAVILAAGFGSRLDAPEGHKILAEIGGRPLFDWHATSFARAGVTELIVVTGFNRAELGAALSEQPLPDGMSVRTAHNPQFELSNGLSILAAEAAPPFWLVMGDHLIEPALFDEAAVAAERFESGEIGGALAVDYELDAVFDMPDANKLRFEDRELVAIGKEIAPFDCVDVGLFWCGTGFVDALRAEFEARGDCNTSDAMRRLDAAGAAEFWDVSHVWWQDVDTPGARAHAEGLVKRAR